MRVNPILRTPFSLQNFQKMYNGLLELILDMGPTSKIIIL